MHLGNDIGGEAANDNSGWLVSLSADGNTVDTGSPGDDDNAPPPSDHFQLFGGRQYIVKKTSHHQRLNRLTSINVDFVRPDNGDVDLIRRIYAETRAKISWGPVTPC